MQNQVLTINDSSHSFEKLSNLYFLLKELSADGDNGELLSDYSTMTPQRTLTASATPAPATDAINRQAQHIMALNETESALKGNLHFILG